MSDSEEPEVIGLFAYGIRMLKYPNGLKAILNELEGDYFDNWRDSLVKTTKKG
jgi:hypothetical protein